MSPTNQPLADNFLSIGPKAIRSMKLRRIPIDRPEGRSLVMAGHRQTWRPPWMEA